MFCHGFHQWDRNDEPVDEPVREPVRVGEARNPDLRVSQAERDEVAAALARHYADGRLSVGEYEERVAAALEARTGRDLDVLLADLPAPAPAASAARAGGQPTGDWRRLAPYLPRILAVTAVVVVALGSGLWFLWLLWPALALTSPHRHRARYHYYRHHGPYRPRTGHRYDHTATRWL